MQPEIQLSLDLFCSPIAQQFPKSLLIPLGMYSSTKNLICCKTKEGLKTQYDQKLSRDSKGGALRTPLHILCNEHLPLKNWIGFWESEAVAGESEISPYALALLKGPLEVRRSHVFRYRRSHSQIRWLQLFPVDFYFSSV